MNDYLKALVGALRSGQQADPDGIMVKVSREACEAAATLLETEGTKSGDVWRKPEDGPPGCECCPNNPANYPCHERDCGFHTEANARRLLAYRAAFIHDDHAEAWNAIYWLVSDNAADPFNPWAELEQLAPDAAEISLNPPPNRWDVPMPDFNCRDCDDPPRCGNAGGCAKASHRGGPSE